MLTLAWLVGALVSVGSDTVLLTCGGPLARTGIQRPLLRVPVWLASPATYSWAIMVYELVTGKHPYDWATKGAKDQQAAQRAVLRAIAGNERQGFQPIGDITFDSLIERCTCDLKRLVGTLALLTRSWTN